MARILIGRPITPRGKCESSSWGGEQRGHFPQPPTTVVHCVIVFPLLKISVFLCDVFGLYTFVFTYLTYKNNFLKKLPTLFIEHWQLFFFFSMTKKCRKRFSPPSKSSSALATASWLWRWRVATTRLSCTYRQSRTFWYCLFGVSGKKTVYLIVSLQHVTVWVYYENVIYRLLNTIQTVQKHTNRQRNRLYLNYACTF